MQGSRGLPVTPKVHPIVALPFPETPTGIHIRLCSTYYPVESWALNFENYERLSSNVV